MTQAFLHLRRIILPCIIIQLPSTNSKFYNQFYLFLLPFTSLKLVSLSWMMHMYNKNYIFFLQNVFVTYFTVVQRLIKRQCFLCFLFSQMQINFTGSSQIKLDTPSDMIHVHNISTFFVHMENTGS